MFKANVLDHGFVILRNMAGPTRRNQNLHWEDGFPITTQHFDADDTDVANAARLSFEGQDQERTYEVEMKLNAYLMKNRHMTPFEVIEVWLEMKLPIFVARQLVRQRTQTINEASARYIQLPKEWYIPSFVGGKPVNKKQGQDDNLDQQTQEDFKFELNKQCKESYLKYQNFLDRGVAPEHARMFLHLNHYTHWMTKMNLRNLMISFLSLRDHSHAQVETQVYARATISLIEPHLPGLMKLYTDLIKEV